MGGQALFAVTERQSEYNVQVGTLRVYPGVSLGAAIVPAAVFFWLGATPADRILPLAIAVPGSVALFLAAVV